MRVPARYYHKPARITSNISCISIWVSLNGLEWIQGSQKKLGAFALLLTLQVRCNHSKLLEYEKCQEVLSRTAWTFALSTDCKLQSVSAVDSSASSLDKRRLIYREINQVVQINLHPSKVQSFSRKSNNTPRSPRLLAAPTHTCTTERLFPKCAQCIFFSG